MFRRSKLTVAAVLGVAVLAAALWPSPAVSQVQPSAAKMKWEYTMLTSRVSPDDGKTSLVGLKRDFPENATWAEVMNTLGGEGWELVTVTAMPPRRFAEETVYTFKRPK